ncbi:endonuclease [Acetobacter senegalensis]|uniref:Endonuclease n=1 Tax=Acetobacter senegalensis TaxID=446692 RepID=A0A0U5FSZ4_9PROT|nr:MULTISPECIES: endonuclease/exonuclease/phosphatase family protein [Acetobacter]KXV58663.1 endonuclease [Acetobacter senegalensis]MCC6103695.1 endonuclease/exonuclease/phosphatase family protein [Acetobacter sp.]MCG4260353.1 endonuclease/exonuclease/phosphatase family protein [Acetobacter senegalensis]MCG4271805.1 endonuclease/exonuclease/phosphatase family protein [Acetobacter senegalensis]MCP1195533.1 endonuclease/exonuclease/phosphatase family protein [Acetobacter senegalensis]
MRRQFLRLIEGRPRQQVRSALNFVDGESTKIISWNLLRRTGATVHDVVALIETEQPDILLMQEATDEIDMLPDIMGGYYARAPLPGRIHGVACWSSKPFARPPRACTIPSGAVVKRHAQIIDYGPFSLANVHLSHGQMLNRRQLRRIAALMPPPCAILGDFNLLGPTLVPGFHDVGPKAPTHKMVDLLPIRIDRCLVDGMTCLNARVLPVFASDHRPIAVRLKPLISALAKASHR